MEAVKLKKQLTPQDFAFSLSGALIPMGFFAAGIYSEIFLSIFIGAPLLLAGLFFATPFFPASECMDLVPKLKGSGKWGTATSAEIGKLTTKLEMLKSKGSAWDTNLAWLVFLGSLILLILSLVLSDELPNLGPDFPTYYFCLLTNVFIFSGAYAMSTSPNLWIPENIQFKLPVLEIVKGMLPSLGAGNWQKEFQLELTDSDLGPVPTDIKLLLKPPDCPPEFLGIQGQVSKNQGQPYVYFVIITKTTLPIVKPRAGDLKKGDLGSSFVNLFTSLLFPKNPDVIEPKTDKEVNILVIRQYADKTGGYITTEADQERLLQLALLGSQQTISRKEKKAV